MGTPGQGAGPLLGSQQPPNQDLGQVSCSCREGYHGDGIRTCELLDPCSQVRPRAPPHFEGEETRQEPASWSPAGSKGLCGMSCLPIGSKLAAQ